MADKKTAEAKAEGRKRPPPLLSRAYLNRAAWHRAIEDWLYSKPDSLVALLQGKSSVPPEARDWLAALALGEIKKKRGARPAEFDMRVMIGNTIRRKSLEREFQHELALERARPKKPGRTDETPKDRAMATVAERNGMTSDQLSQVVYPRSSRVSKSR